MMALFWMPLGLVGQSISIPVEGSAGLVLKVGQDSAWIEHEGGSTDWYFESDLNRLPLNKKDVKEKQAYIWGYTYGMLVLGPIASGGDTIFHHLSDYTSLGNTKSKFGFVFVPIDRLAFKAEYLDNGVIVPLYKGQALLAKGAKPWKQGEIFADDFNFAPEVKGKVIFLYRSGKGDPKALMMEYSLK